MARGALRTPARRRRASGRCSGEQRGAKSSSSASTRMACCARRLPLHERAAPLCVPSARNAISNFTKLRSRRGEILTGGQYELGAGVRPEENVLVL